MAKKWYAHSDKKGSGRQFYEDHIEPVYDIAVDQVKNAVKYYQDQHVAQAVIKLEERSSSLHDIGKMDDENQNVLSNKISAPRLPVNHSYAVVRLGIKTKNFYVAWIAGSHHSFLMNFTRAKKKNKLSLISIKPNSNMDEVIECVERVDNNLDMYCERHNESVCDQLKTSELSNVIDVKNVRGIDMRLALGCLANGDHKNTATHYDDEVKHEQVERKWEERLENTIKKIAELNKISKPYAEITKIRKKFGNHMKNVEMNGLAYCGALVGTGKTYASLIYALRAAIMKNSDRIFYVTPFISLVNQTAKSLRDVVELNGEVFKGDLDKIVCEHHHQIPLDKNLSYAREWEAPFVVTTAVSFFETISNNYAVGLKNLHKIANSVIVIDEAHMIPVKLWGQYYKWFEILVKDWNCTILMMSGSMVKFWDMDHFADAGEPLTPMNDLVTEELYEEMKAIDDKKIVFKEDVRDLGKQFLNINEVCDLIMSKSGSKLAIFNTIMNSALVARELKKRGAKVFQLYTALAPRDREKILNEIIYKVEKTRKYKKYKKEDWVLVGTSCIEAGWDGSFKYVFREKCSAASVIQTSGRCNRYTEYKKYNYDDCGEVWSFTLQDEGVTQNSQFNLSIQILNEMFVEGRFINIEDYNQLVSEAIEIEMNHRDNGIHYGCYNFEIGEMVYDTCSIQQLYNFERQLEFERVSSACKIIKTGTRVVIINPKLVEALENGFHVKFRDIMYDSVQMWATRIRRLEESGAIRLVNGFDNIYKWERGYDPECMGYMKGIFEMMEAGEDIPGFNNG